MDTVEWDPDDDDEDEYGYVCKPTYFESVDPYELQRVEGVLSEIFDAFSPAQLAQHDMWRKNEVARRKEACLRRRYGDLRPMSTGEFNYKEDGYSVARLLLKRDSLVNEVYDSKRIATRLNEHVNSIVPVLVPMLSDRLNADRGVVEQSTRALFAGMNELYPGLKAVRRMMWILAANALKLQAGEVVTLFEKPLGKEWSPVLVTAHIDRPWKPDRWLYEFFILGGTGATCTFTQEIPYTTSSYAYLVNHMFRIGRKSKRVTKLGRFGFVGMRTWVLLEPGDRRMFNSSACCDIFMRENREVYDTRRKPCQYGQPCYCDECHKGLEDCKFAMHKSTYFVGYCESCRNASAWLPDRFSTTCVTCAKRK